MNQTSGLACALCARCSRPAILLSLAAALKAGTISRKGLLSSIISPSQSTAPNGPASGDLPGFVATTISPRTRTSSLPLLPPIVVVVPRTPSESSVHLENLMWSSCNHAPAFFFCYFELPGSITSPHCRNHDKPSSCREAPVSLEEHIKESANLRANAALCAADCERETTSQGEVSSHSVAIIGSSF